jgi:transcriptional regulator with XRE-family HTH domain
MGAETDYGRKRPNGPKIVELRKEKGLKQQALADDADISVRLLREIERNNHPVPATTITAIAAELKVNPGDITLSAPDAPPSTAGSLSTESLLKLRAIRSATELAALAERANRYKWGLRIDPSTTTAGDMQGLMKTIHRLVNGPAPVDEFDEEDFGQIPRLALLQDLLTRLRTNGVSVIAGTYTYSSLRNLEEGEQPDFGEICVRRPGNRPN